MYRFLLRLIFIYFTISTTCFASEAIDYSKPIAEDIIVGNQNAPVTMIAYSSLTCPHCAYFHNDIYEKLKTKYIENGKLKFIHRDLPFDRAAFAATALAHCRGNDFYYIFLKVLFTKQETWATNKNYLEMLGNIGKIGGVSADQFEKCLADKKFEEKILTLQLGSVKQLDIKGTPFILINGIVFDDALTLDKISEKIEVILKEGK
jgi:protein-disulfide isomerase